uniref:Uncharacterized protein n=1 Tax=Plectus sambesii TaxID=2011161 RepID=A0A914UH76_9BILA
MDNQPSKSAVNLQRPLRSVGVIVIEMSDQTIHVLQPIVRPRSVGCRRPLRAVDGLDEHSPRISVAGKTAHSFPSRERRRGAQGVRVWHHRCALRPRNEQSTYTDQRNRRRQSTAPSSRLVSGSGHFRFDNPLPIYELVGQALTESASNRPSTICR